MKLTFFRKKKVSDKKVKRANQPTLYEIEEMFKEEEETDLQKYTFTFKLERQKK